MRYESNSGKMGNHECLRRTQRRLVQPVSTMTCNDFLLIFYCSKLLKKILKKSDILPSAGFYLLLCFFTLYLREKLFQRFVSISCNAGIYLDEVSGDLV